MKSVIAGAIAEASATVAAMEMDEEEDAVRGKMEVEVPAPDPPIILDMSNMPLTSSGVSNQSATKASTSSDNCSLLSACEIDSLTSESFTDVGDSITEGLCFNPGLLIEFAFPLGTGLGLMSIS
jgi:hypothetical protein